MERRALLMELPDGKLPGFYAQIVKALADAVNLFDRDKVLIILEDISDSPSVEQVLQRYHIAYEPIHLIQLPQSLKLKPHYDDFGFTSRSGNTYFYADLVTSFQLVSDEADPYAIRMASEQLDEHILATYDLHQNHYYVIEGQHIELVHGIARAYHCRALF
jgi:hypothetical protein